MIYTHHAEHRAQKRCIPPMLVDLLIQFGRQESSGDGTFKVFFDKNARRNLRTYAGAMASAIEQHLDVYAVVGSDMQVITVAHREDRIHRH